MFIFILALSFSSKAKALDYSSSVADRFNQEAQLGLFYDTKNLPFSPRNFDRLTRAAVPLSNLEQICTGVILSPEGYVATAAHCLRACLHDGYEYKPNLNMSIQAQEGVYEFIRIHDQTAPQFNCPDYYMQPFTIFDYSLQSAKVVWFGRGLSVASDSYLTHMSATQFEQMKDLTEDIVILKYDVYDSSIKIPCVPVAESGPEPGEAVWAIGYPTVEPGYVFNGYKKAVSMGRVQRSVQTDPSAEAFAAKLNSKEKAQYLTRISTRWDKPSLVLATLRASQGNSGGPIVNQDGELVAILFGSMAASVPGSYTLGVNLPLVRQEIRQTLGPDAAQKIFNCPRPQTVSAGADKDRAL